MNGSQLPIQPRDEERIQPVMPHQLMGYRDANILAAHQAICDEVNLPIEDYPPYISRGIIERKTINRFHGYDLRSARKTFSQRFRDAICRLLMRK
jgi:hypothetical protein